MTFRLLPFVSCEIHSALSPEKIQTILRENTEPKVYFRASHEHKYFEGEVSKEEFRYGDSAGVHPIIETR